MRRRGLTGSFWPTPTQELLLETALGERDSALAAWRRARPRIDVDRLEEGSFALVPLIYRRLSDGGVDDPDLPKLKGIFRHTWSRNQVLLDRLRSVLAVLAEPELEALVVRGAALAVRYYPELGLRPTTEFEVLVRQEDAGRALSALAKAGWTPHGAAPRLDNPAQWPNVRLRGPDGHTFVLHWGLLPEFAPAGDFGRASEPFWEAAQQLPADAVPALALASTDELLHACLTGARSAPWANVQWIADAAMVLRTSGEEVDWDRFVELAAVRRAVPRLRDAVAYLRRRGDPIPAAVDERLRGLPTSPRETASHRIGAYGGGVAGEFPRALAHHVRWSGGGSLGLIAGLPRFLRELWRLEHSWQVPLFVARKGLSRMRVAANRTKTS